MAANKNCPRCGGPADEARTGPGYPRPGALSRWDNETIICTSCGTDEAMAQFAAHTGGRAAAQAAVHPVTGSWPWVIPPKGA